MAVSSCQACGAPFRPAAGGENVCPICVVEIRTRREATLEMRASPKGPDDSDRRRGPKALVESRPSENRRRQRAGGRAHPPAAAAFWWLGSSLVGAVALVFVAYGLGSMGMDVTVARICIAIFVALEQAACLYLALAAYWAADRW